MPNKSNTNNTIDIMTNQLLVIKMKKWFIFLLLCCPLISFAEGERNFSPPKLVYEPPYFSNALPNPVLMAHTTAPTLNSPGIMPGQESNCWDAAGRVYQLDPWLLFSIAKVESGFRSHAINRDNKNKTIDIGLMQINSTWLPTIKRFGIEPSALFEPCVSIHVGAWILAQNIKHFGYNIDGIGAYNSPRNVKIRRSYAQKVAAAYRDLTVRYYWKPRVDTQMWVQAQVSEQQKKEVGVEE